MITTKIKSHYSFIKKQNVLANFFCYGKNPNFKVIAGPNACTTEGEESSCRKDYSCSIPVSEYKNKTIANWS